MHSDYFLRMIEQFVQALAYILRLRKEGQVESALFEIQSASQKFLNTDISFFLTLTPQQLVNHFAQNAEGAIICAELLQELANICKAKQELEVASNLEVSSFHLFASVIPHHKRFQTNEYIEKADKLLEGLQEKQLKEDVSQQFLKWRKTGIKLDK